MAYHHGDARAVLIAAAGEWLEEVGAAGLSLRGVAERAGLSRQAPYNHFADKEAM
ncbi:TetR family transcriptional regulator, partial [Nostoc sp. 3335mG]